MLRHEPPCPPGRHAHRVVYLSMKKCATMLMIATWNQKAKDCFDKKRCKTKTFKCTKVLSSENKTGTFSHFNLKMINSCVSRPGPGNRFLMLFFADLHPPLKDRVRRLAPLRIVVNLPIGMLTDKANPV